MTAPDLIAVPALAAASSLAWTTAVEGWLRSLTATGATPLTLRLRRCQIGHLARDLVGVGPWEVTGEQLEDWLGSHAWKLPTLGSNRAAVRSFYEWAARRGRVPVSPAGDLPRVRQRMPKPRPAPEIAYQHALTRSDDRVALMVRLAAELGLRRAEVSVVHSADVEPDLEGWTLLVHGKGRKVRRLPMTDDLAELVRAAPAGWLFPGKIDGHLSADRVGRLVAGALPSAWTMHTLRHRFGTVAYVDSGHDLATVQDLMGHSSPVTTRIYVEVPAANLRRTIEAIARR